MRQACLHVTYGQLRVGVEGCVFLISKVVQQKSVRMNYCTVCPPPKKTDSRGTLRKQAVSERMCPGDWICSAGICNILPHLETYFLNKLVFFFSVNGQAFGCRNNLLIFTEK